MSDGAVSHHPFRCALDAEESQYEIDIDSPDFDAVKAVDALCGNEPDEADLFELMTVLEGQIVRVDEEILSVLRAQSQRSMRAHSELAQAKDDIVGLNNTMGETLQQANETQREVDALCQDIRAMDDAKRHLTKSISVLENFGTLTRALAELKESSSDSSKYRENASKLESVLCLMETFEVYKDVAKVEAVKDIVDVITRNLHQQVLREFQLQWTISDPFSGRLALTGKLDFDERERIRLEREQVVRNAAPKFDAIRAAAPMASALERRTQCRSTIINDIVVKWMNALHATCLDLRFEVGQVPLDEHFQSVVDWLLNVLTKNTFFVEQWKALPDDWQVQRQLAERFCEEVEVHFNEVLDEWSRSASGGLEERSTALLKALVVTREFEHTLMARLDNVRTHAAIDASASSYSAVKARAAAHLQPRVEAGTPRRSEFEGKLRKVFSKHLKLVVDWHGGALEKALRLLLDADASNAWKGTIAPGRLDSARSLLNECRDHCDKAMLYLNHSGSSVESFVSMLQAKLRAYAEALAARLPGGKDDGLKRGGGSGGGPTAASLDELRRVCCIANTAQYVAEMVPELAAFVAQGCAPEVPAALDMAPLTDEFDTLRRSALSAVRAAMLAEVCRFVDGTPPGGMKPMLRHSWLGLKQTSDSSGYATGITSFLATWPEAACELLVPQDSSGDAPDTSSFENVCSGMALDFVRHMLQHGILRLRGLNQEAVNQLAIDFAHVREALLQFPGKALAATQPRDAASVGWQDEVSKRHRAVVEPALQQVLSLVKVLQVFDDDRAFVSHYQQLLPQEYQSADKMQRVLGILKLESSAAVSNRLQLLRGNPAITLEGAAKSSMPVAPTTVASVANTWASSAAGAVSSARSGSVLSSMALLKSGQGFQGGAFKAGASELFSNVRDKFASARRT